MEEEIESNSIKIIVLPIVLHHKQIPVKTIKKREVTKKGTWVKKISKEDFTKAAQLSLLTAAPDSENKKQSLMYSQIKQKICGYWHQDTLKKKINEQSFVDLPFVIQLLIQSDLLCFYCREDVHLFYEQVRDPKQWTLERLYNTKGHDKGNVEICCLSCNIKRRTMFHEKYKFTKQITFQKET